jgi:2-polyprenyl-3-methyl-5-hydroxy-6-metoxy-1,4-benzoquinol methylase
MDSPDINGPVLETFHRDLIFVNRALGTFGTIERFLRKSDPPVRSVLDIGCGSGALLDHLRRRMNVEVIGVDLKPWPMTLVPVVTANAVVDRLPEADAAVTTLMAHHLTPEENIALIRNVSRSCRRFLIHDLIRHPVPMAGFTIFLGPLIGREARLDGRQSIRRAFTPRELSELVQTALAGTAATFTQDVSPFLSRQVMDIRF